MATEGHDKAADGRVYTELYRKQDLSLRKSQAVQSPYFTQVGTYRSRCAGLDQTRTHTDSKVMDWNSLPGVRRSLPTNIPDEPAKINTNMLKFKRDTDFTNTTPHDGGPSYNGEVCCSNWVQERHDRNWKSGFHPKELRRDTRYATEYTQRFVPTSDEYRNRIVSVYNTTKRFEGLDRVGTDGIAKPVRPPSANSRTGEHVRYAHEGFGQQDHQDHTLGTKRGNFWVGTADHKPHEALTATTMRQEEIEFQRRCPSEDARSKILLGNKPLNYVSEGTQRIRDELTASARLTSAWRTMYTSDYKDFSRPVTAPV